MVNHRPRSSVMLFARLMGEKYAGTPLAKYFTISDFSNHQPLDKEKITFVMPEKLEHR